MKNLIITLLVLLLSLTSCKEKEDMNKKYHWVAYVKPVAGYPIRTYRGVVYGKDGASKFGTSSNFIFFYLVFSPSTFPKQYFFFKIKPLIIIRMDIFGFILSDKSHFPEIMFSITIP